MFNSLSLRAKIIASFALVILFILLVVATGFISSSMTSNYADIQAKQMDVVQNAQKLDRDVFNMRFYCLRGMYIKDMPAQKNKDGQPIIDVVNNVPRTPSYHFYMINGIDGVAAQADETLKLIENELPQTAKGREDRTRCESIRRLFKEYSTITTGWANEQDQVLESLAKQKTYAQDVRVPVSKILERVGEIIERPSDHRKEFKLDEEGNQVLDASGKPTETGYFVSHRLVGRQERLGAILAIVEQMETKTVELEAKTDPVTLEKLQKEITLLFDDMRARIKKLEEEFTTAESKVNAEEARKAFDLWEAEIKVLTGITNKQSRIFDNMTEVGRKAVVLIEELVANAQANAKEAGESLDSTSRMSNILMLAVGIFVVILGVVLGLVLSGNIAGATSKITELLGKVVNLGDITVQVPYDLKNRGDEVGELSRTVEGIIGDYLSVSGLAKKLADGDWTVSSKLKSEQDDMNINLNGMISKINESLSSVAEAVEKVSTGAKEIASASDSLAGGATESAASIEEITASMSEMGSQINDNAKNAKDASVFAKQASDAGADGQKIMEKMITSMQDITKNAQEVQKVIKVIDDISFQTNLLALNAAVEAARAGVHGKGFAVVAEEVRNLASRSAKAAQETTEMIEGNNRQINAGAELATETADMLNQIVDHASKTSKLIQQIATASNEQAQGIAQVTQGLQQIDSVTQQNTASAEETASVSNEMSSQSLELQKLIDFFRL